MDWTIYWFMFPVSICVATVAMLSGIGGAALFIPIFLVLFPLLGPEYPLDAAAAIGTALITAFFGFSSGFAGYSRRRLIDFRSAAPFIALSVPVAVAGALLLAVLREHDVLLKAAYALLMLGMCPAILRRSPPGAAADDVPMTDTADHPSWRRIVSRDGRAYAYPAPRLGFLGTAMTGAGAFLTGLLGVGIGEVVVPQLVMRHRIPVAVATGTSVLIVIANLAAASFTQVIALVSAGGVDAIPWNLVGYTVPGVLCGGQIGPWLQGRIAQRTMERAIAILFGFIGLAMGLIVLRALGWIG